MRAMTTLLVAGMLAGQAHAVWIGSTELPAKYFKYREGDNLPLEIKSFRPTTWEQFLPTEEPYIQSSFAITFVAPDGRTAWPSQSVLYGGLYRFSDPGVGREVPQSGYSATMLYDYSFDTYVGGPPIWQQTTETILTLLPLSTITFDPGGRVPGGVYIGGELVPWIAGDLNGDDTIDANDAGVAFANWGKAGLSDLNGDGTTDAADAGAIFEAWTGDTSAVSVPEPHGLALAFLLLAAFTGVVRYPRP